MILTYFVIYFLLTFVLPTLKTFKQTGINPITFGKNDNAHDLIGFYMKAVMLFIFISALEADRLIPFEFTTFFNQPYIKMAGVACMVLSLIWIV
ncbi:MAG: hypothetical protein K2Q18_02445, partial [Bdellovibrionales bacterium]|nr:hypothetical protein [Bdellovibrionales bacterium]